MPVFTRTFQIVAGILSVAVFNTAVIGAAYNSPFLEHLADQVNGASTNVFAALNAPNWSYAIPIATPVATNVATSSGGTMASSTTVYFAVAALDGFGTTTISNILSATTNASSSLLAAEGFEISWGMVSGATGYAIYFGSSASSLTNYVYATSSGAYFLATTTGQLTGAYTKADTTAFAAVLNANGPSFINSANAAATSSVVASTTVLQLNGNFVATSPATTTGCFAATAGAMFFNASNGHAWGCDGTAWRKIF